MEFGAYFRFVLALVFVLGLIGGIALLARRLVPGARTINRGSVRRLAIIEVLSMDTKRRLVLLRRDDTEHLVIIGPTGETVVERNIGTQFDRVLADTDQNVPLDDDTIALPDRQDQNTPRHPA
ncbi:MAG: flagellar biosynthetic protein FliO [Pseudomonadota bacterium]